MRAGRADSPLLMCTPVAAIVRRRCTAMYIFICAHIPQVINHSMNVRCQKPAVATASMSKALRNSSNASCQMIEIPIAASVTPTSS